MPKGVRKAGTTAAAESKPVNPRTNGAALKARIAELEALEADRQRALKVEDALYRIADTASSIHEMAEFYPAMHAIVGELMNAENFYIALYDEERQLLNYPYYVDSVDTSHLTRVSGSRSGPAMRRGITAYAICGGEPLLGRQRGVLRACRERRYPGTGGQIHGESGWLGVPLKAEGQTLGIVVVQDYQRSLSQHDKDLLIFVGQHIATALSRARAIEETRERNAELAVINEIGDALARQLDFQAIIELVGEKVREIFDVQTMTIALYDPATQRDQLSVRSR